MSRHILTGLPPQQPRHQAAEQLTGQASAASKQPPESDVHPLAGPRRPEYVLALWVSKELRDRIRRNNAALALERKGRGSRRHGYRAEPDAELEAEP
jgi:hypothetical protein